MSLSREGANVLIVAIVRIRLARFAHFSLVGGLVKLQWSRSDTSANVYWTVCEFASPFAQFVVLGVTACTLSGSAL